MLSALWHNSSSHTVAEDTWSHHDVIAVGALTTTERVTPDASEAAATGLDTVAIEFSALSGQTQIRTPGLALLASARSMHWGASSLAQSANQLDSQSYQFELQAEALALEVGVGVDIALNPKALIDSLGSVYEHTIDTVVDWVAGRDLPGMPTAPDRWDRALIFSIRATAGWGVAAQLAIKASRSEALTVVGAALKLSPSGMGPTAGAALTLQVEQ